MELPFVSALLPLGVYPKNPETLTQKNPFTPMFRPAQFGSQASTQSTEPHQPGPEFSKT